jgi:hypothetical protein
MNTPYENVIDNISNQRMIKDIAQIMLFELLNLDKKDQIEYLEDLLCELSHSSLKTYFDDLGCLEAYFEQFNEH